MKREPPKKLRGAHKNAKSKARGIIRRAKRRAEAEARVTEWRKLSLKQQLAKLPPGGARRQRASIENQLAQQT